MSRFYRDEGNYLDDYIPPTWLVAAIVGILVGFLIGVIAV